MASFLWHLSQKSYDGKLAVDCGTIGACVEHSVSKQDTIIPITFGITEGSVKFAGRKQVCSKPLEAFQLHFLSESEILELHFTS